MAFIENSNPYTSLDVVVSAIGMLAWMIFRIWSRLNSTASKGKSSSSTATESKRRIFCNNIQSLHILFRIIATCLMCSLVFHLAAESILADIKYNPRTYGFYALPNQHGRLAIMADQTATKPPVTSNPAIGIYTTKADLISIAQQKAFVADICGTAAMGMDVTVMFLVVVWLMRGLLMGVGWIVTIRDQATRKLLKKSANNNIVDSLNTRVGYIWFLTCGALSWVVFLVVATMLGNQTVPFAIDGTVANNDNTQILNHAVWTRVFVVRCVYIAITLYGIVLLSLCKVHMMHKYFSFSEANSKTDSLAHFGATDENQNDARMLRGRGTKRYRIASRCCMWITVFVLMRLVVAMSVGALTVNIFTLMNATTATTSPADAVGWGSFWVDLAIKTNTLALMFSYPVLLEILLSSASLDDSVSMIERLQKAQKPDGVDRIKSFSSLPLHVKVAGDFSASASSVLWSPSDNVTLLSPLAIRRSPIDCETALSLSGSPRSTIDPTPRPPPRSKVNVSHKLSL